MTYSTFKRLLNLGILSCSTFIFAQTAVSGELRLNSSFVLKQNDALGRRLPSEFKYQDDAYISRARLDFQGTITNDTQFHVRLEKNEFTNQQLRLSPDFDTQSISYNPYPLNTFENSLFSLALTQAYVSYKGLENVHLDLGLLAVSEISADKIYYQPYIGTDDQQYAVGTIMSHVGYYPAAMQISWQYGSLRYQGSFWAKNNADSLSLTQAELEHIIYNPQTDGQYFYPSSFKTQLLLGTSQRLSHIHHMSQNKFIAVGLGYSSAPLNHNILGLTIVQKPDNLANTQVWGFGASVYDKRLHNIAADLSCSFQHIQLNAGYQYQELKNGASYAQDSTYYPDGGAASAADIATYFAPTNYNLFKQKGSATGLWLEVGYLFSGAEYIFSQDKAVVSGVQLKDNQSALEIVLRYGTEHRQNILALLSPAGWQDANYYIGDGDSGFALRNQNQITASLTTVEGQPNARALIIEIDNRDSDGHDEFNIINNNDPHDFFETRMTGFALSSNYYLSPQTVFKIEFESRNNEYKKTTVQQHIDWQSSVIARNVCTLRLRADYSF